MSSIQRTYTFADGAKFVQSQAEVEFSNIVNTWNNHDQGVSSWTVVKSAGSVTVTGAGLGLVLKTPDGTHTWRIAIDNDGTITREQVT